MSVWKLRFLASVIIWEYIWTFASIWGVWKHCKYIIFVLRTSLSVFISFLSHLKGWSVLGVNLVIELLCWEVNQGLQSFNSVPTSFLTPVYSTMVGKNVHIYSVKILRKYIESRHFYSYPSLQSKLSSKFLSSSPWHREITHSPRQRFSKNLFSQKAERGGGNYDLLYQNSTRKYEDDLQY